MAYSKIERKREREGGTGKRSRRGRGGAGEGVNVLILLTRNHCSISSGKGNIFPRIYSEMIEKCWRKILNTDENLNCFGDYHVSRIAMTIITHICVTDCTIIRKYIIHIQENNFQCKKNTKITWNFRGEVQWLWALLYENEKMLNLALNNG